MPRNSWASPTSTERWWAARASRRTSSWQSRASTDRLASLKTTILEDAMRMKPALIAGKLVALAVFMAATTDAAEIKLVDSKAMKRALHEVTRDFEVEHEDTPPETT